MLHVHAGCLFNALLVIIAYIGINLAMNKKSIKKNIDSLIVLKQRQQNSVREEIFTIKATRQNKVAEIDKVEDEMQSKDEEYALRKTMFYRDTIANVFSNKDMRSFQIDLERIDREGNDLYKKKDVLIKELWEIDERLRLKQEELKSLIVREEKYNYIRSSFVEVL